MYYRTLVSLSSLLTDNYSTFENGFEISGIKVAETVKALTELKHTPASPNSIRRLAGISGSAQNIFQPQQMPAERPSSFQSGGNAISGSNSVFSTFQNQAKVCIKRYQIRFGWFQIFHWFLWAIKHLFSFHKSIFWKHVYVHIFLIDFS